MRRQRGSLGATLTLGQRHSLGNNGTERRGPAVPFDVTLRFADDPQGVGFSFVARAPPRRDAVATQDHTRGVWIGVVNGADVDAQLKTGPSPRQP